MKEKTAKYELVKQDIMKKIENREYKSNQVIPSEYELCDFYQVSRITIRKAMDELVQEGYLYRIKGKGSFVRSNASEGLSRIHSFTEAVIHQGKTPSKKLLSLTTETPDNSIRAKMGLASNETVYVIKTLYLADEKPYCINTSILPVSLFPKLEFLDLSNHSLYEVLKMFYHLTITKACQVLNATTGSREIYDFLNADSNRPLLKINAASYCFHDENERVFELYESYILTDILSYYVEKYNM